MVLEVAQLRNEVEHLRKAAQHENPDPPTVAAKEKEKSNAEDANAEAMQLRDEAENLHKGAQQQENTDSTAATRHSLAERLYEKISATHGPQLAIKIVPVILEQDVADVISLLAQPQELSRRVAYAANILAGSDASPAVEASPQVIPAQRRHAHAAELKVFASIRKALEHANALEVLDSPRQFVIPFGSTDSANNGHDEVRAYDTYDHFTDIESLLAGSSVWLKRAMGRTRSPPVIICRTLQGLSTVVLLRDVPPASISQRAGWRSSCKVVTMPAYGKQGETKELDFQLDPIHRVMGTTALLSEVLSKAKITLDNKREFGNVTRGVCPLTDVQANSLRQAGLLVMKNDAIVSSSCSKRMLTVDFVFQAKSDKILTFLVDIQQGEKRCSRPVLVNMAASGDLPQYLQEILLADVMFGLVKPDSSLRPVSIVNVVVKIAATLLMSNVNCPKASRKVAIRFWAIERTANLCAEDPEIPEQRICRRKDGCGKCVWHR